MDELAYWRLHGAVNSGEEIQLAIRRGQLLIPDAKIVKISTAYAQAGVLHDDFTNHWGKDSRDVLVWRSTTAEMNPSVTPELLDRMRRTMSPGQFRREFEGALAADFTQFLSDAWVSAADSGEARDLPKVHPFKYVAGVDPKGTGKDAFTLSIAHKDGDRVVQDLVRAWDKPRTGVVNLDGIVHEICALVVEYGIERVYDRYAPGWVARELPARVIGSRELRASHPSGARRDGDAHGSQHGVPGGRAPVRDRATLAAV